MSRKDVELRKDVANILRQVSDLKCLQDEETQKSIHTFIERTEDNSFCVAVVGTVSSGKSTFLNALIGTDLLTHGSQETTAVLVRLNNISQDDPRSGKCIVHYIDGTQQELNNTEKLSQFSAIQHSQKEELPKTFDVSRDVASVDVYLHFVDSDSPVILVDTPGLNGTKEYHREKTIDQICRAHACIYLLPVRGLSQFDINLIHDLCIYQQDFIFVQNFADSLKAEGEGEELQKKVNEQSELLREKVFHEYPDVNYRVCAVSARNALISREHKFKKVYDTDREELNEKARSELYVESNFQAVLDELQRLVVENQKGRRQLMSTIQAAISTLNIEYECMIQESENVAEFNGISRRGKSFQDRKEQLDEAEKRKLEKLYAFWKSECYQNKIRQKNLIEEKVKAIESYVQKSIDDCKDAENIEQYCHNNMLQRLLNPCIQKAELRLTEEVQECFEGSMALAVTQIVSCAEWLAIEETEMKKTPIVVKSKRPVEDIHDRDGIYKQELEGEKARKSSIIAQQQMQKVLQEQSQSREQLQEYLQSKQRETARYEAICERQGEEPLTEFITKTEYKHHSGLFAGLRDWCFGQVRYTYTVEDTSKRDAWWKQYTSIKNKHNQQMCTLNEQINGLEFKLQNIEQLIEQSSQDYEAANKRYQMICSKIREMKAIQEERRKKANDEYVETTQKELRKALTEYLYGTGGVKEVWTEVFLKAIEKNGETGWNQVEKLYQRVVKKRMHQLQQGMENISKKEQVLYPDLEEFGKLLQQLKEVIK